MINYYEILEVKSDTSDEVIKAAYKALIKKYHPDNGGKNDSTGEKLRLVNEAFDILSNPDKRKKYDSQFQKEYKKGEDKTDEHVQNTEHQMCQNHQEKQNYQKVDRTENKDNIFSKIISGIVNGVQNSVDCRKAEIENAYFEAGTMPDYTLVENYKNTTGARRIGFRRELEKRGMLIRDSNGNWRPSGKMYW